MKEEKKTIKAKNAAKITKKIRKNRILIVFKLY